MVFVGGILTADSLNGGPRQENFILKDINPRLSADAFASVGISTQLGHFQRWFLDYSKVDAHLNVGSAAVLVTSALNPEKVNKEVSILPTLEVTLQQQALKTSLVTLILYNAYSLRMLGVIFSLDFVPRRYLAHSVLE